jgi:hypothetical protein
MRIYEKGMGLLDGNFGWKGYLLEHIEIIFARGERFVIHHRIKQPQSALLCIQERKEKKREEFLAGFPKTKRLYDPILDITSTAPSQPCPGPGCHCYHPADHPWARPFR